MAEKRSLRSLNLVSQFGKGEKEFSYQSMDSESEKPAPGGDEDDDGEWLPDGIHWIFATMIYINALVGAGILNFPYSIHVAGGIPVAVSIQLAMVLIIWSAVTAMVWCSHKKGSCLYQDTVYMYLGGWGRNICTILMLVFCFLMTTIYLVAIGQQLSAGFKIVLNLKEIEWYISKEFLVPMVAALIIFPFCLVKHIGRLHYASSVATATVALVAFVVIYEYFHTDKTVAVTKWTPEKWTDVFLSIPAYATAYMFDLASVAVYGRLKKKSPRTFLKASGVALFSVFAFYNVFAGFAYMTFGATIHPNFMTNYHEGTWVIASAQFLYSLKLCLEFPIFQYLGWTAILTFSRFSFSEACAPCVQNEDSPNSFSWFRAVTSVVWIGSTVMVAICAPNINYVLPLSSATVLHFQMTFPGLCIIRALSTVGHKFSRFKVFLLRIYGVGLIFFGCCLSLILIGQYIQQLKHDEL